MLNNNFNTNAAPITAQGIMGRFAATASAPRQIWDNTPTYGAPEVGGMG